MKVETKETIPLKERLAYSIPLRFPNFDKFYQIGPRPPVTTLSFEDLDCRDWYREMVEQILKAIEDHQFLPVYRMGDGEYRFALGRRARKPWHQMSLREIARTAWVHLTGKAGVHRSGSTHYGLEEYTREEIAELHPVFVRCLREVAEKGILALGMHANNIYKDYIVDILNWFDENEIDVRRENYYHVFSMYVLMHGPDRDRLLKNRRVLVVTGLTDSKREGIETGLANVGVADVQFLPISLKKSLKEKLDLSSVKLPIDVVLVGAGVGSASILCQLAPLQTACLDVGFALSTLANPELRWYRTYCVPDSEFDITRGRWSPPEELEAQRKRLLDRQPVTNQSE